MTGSRQRLRRTWLLALLAGVPLAGCTGILSRVGFRMSKELRANGVSAPAEIQEIWDTGWTVNHDPVIGMKVRVQPAGLPAFEATIAKTLVSRIGLYQFEPGNVIPVRFDPRDPTVIAVDFEPPAAYWRKTGPGILGIVFRSLDSREQARLGSGVVVDAVAEGSPAASARIAAGDVIVAIEGTPVADALALPPLLGSLAGKAVRIDLIRNGSPSSVTAQLNPAPP